MTIPAGLVKLTSQAPGARRAVRSARSTMAGIVRSAKQMPPAPIVSWPSTPCPSGTPSSTVRPSSPPTRIATKTKPAPSSASSRSVVVRNGTPVAVLGGLALEHLGDAVEPLGVDVVEDDLVERRDAGAARRRRAGRGTLRPR